MGEKLKEVPMGVSEWKAHGKKYGYDKYFIKKALKKQREEIIKIIDTMEIQATQSGNEKQEEITNILLVPVKEKLINTIKNI